MSREQQRRFDRMAAARLSKVNGGIPRHIALSNQRSITLRNKLKRLGLEGDHVEAALNMVDEIGLQEVMSEQPLGSRFASMPQAKRSAKIWKA
tara:strand:- start:1000 stop:1278 length:279 start_codon:yes stop_codon:yes gene_type:complete